MSTKARATIEDLYGVPGKAELVNGEIVHMSPTGGRPGYAGDEIAFSLREHISKGNKGIAVSDNKAFIVDLPHRRSFSPDAAFHTGKMRAGFYIGAPIFAVEVRSEGDYGPAAEKELADKRQDYFAAGTKVVWDVDVLRDNVVRVYKADSPASPTIYRPGEIADAEPAVPGWRMLVDHLFPDPEFTE